MLLRRKDVKDSEAGEAQKPNVANDDQLDENALIDRTLNGETAAFGLLVRRYQDRLYTTITHLVGSPEDARDIVQDAFVQSFVKLDTFRRNAAFYTWLYRIAFNLAIGFRRKKKNNVSMDQMKAVAGSEPEEPTEGPDGQLEADERAAQVRRAINMLSEEHRRVLVLREMEGCCYEEIAEILDLAVGTVRSRLHRARLQLRDFLHSVYQQQLD